MAATLTSPTATGTLLSSAAADPSVPQSAGLSSSIDSTAQLSALLATQVQAATSAGAASGASLASILTSVSQLTKAAVQFQSDIVSTGAAAPTASALQASAARQVVDVALIASVVSSAASAATAAEATLAAAVSFTIRASNPAAFWTASVISSAQGAVSSALLSACFDQNAVLSTSVVALARRRLLAGGSAATSRTVGFTNTIDLGVARNSSSALLQSLAAALGGVGLTGVTVVSADLIVAAAAVAAASSPPPPANSSSNATSDASSSPSTLTVNTIVIITVVVAVVFVAALVAAIVYMVRHAQTRVVMPEEGEEGAEPKPPTQPLERRRSLPILAIGGVFGTSSGERTADYRVGGAAEEAEGQTVQRPRSASRIRVVLDGTDRPRSTPTTGHLSVEIQGAVRPHGSGGAAQAGEALRAATGGGANRPGGGAHWLPRRPPPMISESAAGTRLPVARTDPETSSPPRLEVAARRPPPHMLPPLAGRGPRASGPTEPAVLPPPRPADQPPTGSSLPRVNVISELPEPPFRAPPAPVPAFGRRPPPLLAGRGRDAEAPVPTVVLAEEAAAGTRGQAREDPAVAANAPSPPADASELRPHRPPPRIKLAEVWRGRPPAPEGGSPR